MKKYVCEVCGWVYDEEEGAPDMGMYWLIMLLRYLIWEQIQEQEQGLQFR